MRRGGSLHIIAFLFLAGLISILPLPVDSATNVVLGGLGGIDNGTIGGGDGTGTGRFTINAVPLSLVKQARDVSGAVLPDGTAVAPGQTVYFVLMVNNPTDFPAANIRLADPINEAQFTYIADSLEVTTVGTATDPWSGIWTPVSDTLAGPDDIGSVIDSNGIPGLDRITIGTVSGQVNQPLSIAGSTLWALRFRVVVK
jgi:uncharacterized repeat protein (TIGR01451 family)